jgi:hypothetical protein
MGDIRYRGCFGLGLQLVEIQVKKWSNFGSFLVGFSGEILNFAG